MHYGTARHGRCLDSRLAFRANVYSEGRTDPEAEEWHKTTIVEDWSRRREDERLWAIIRALGWRVLS